MAFLFKRAQSQYWHAGWKDEKGKRIKRLLVVVAKHVDDLKLAGSREDILRVLKH